MRHRPRSRPLSALLAALLLAAWAPAQESEAPCLQGQGPAACARCHPGEGEVRWAQTWRRPGAPFCQGCHARKELERHHPIGVVLARNPKLPLHLGEGLRLTCSTCHDLSRPRYDSVRWRSESLFDRLFRREPRHKTYFLALRNDRGGLCLACH